MTQTQVPEFGHRAGVVYIDRPCSYGILFNSKLEIAIVSTSYGYFLPGGGLDPNEDFETALKRELMEEIGYELKSAEFFGEAIQFHWSAHYQKNFRKIGHFYRIKADPPDADFSSPGHELIWWRKDRAERGLSQEFQRYALSLL